MPLSAFATLDSDAVERDVSSLVDLVRLSRVTVLLAEDADTSTFLRTRIVPRLQGVQPGGEREVCVFFDAWDGPLLPALLARVDTAMAPIAGVKAGTASMSAPLVARLGAWAKAFNVSLVLVLDRFEAFFARSADDPEAGDFLDQFVDLLNSTHVAVNVLISIDEGASASLAALRERVPELGDAVLRLPRRTTQTLDAERIATPEAATPRLLGSEPNADPARTLDTSEPEAAVHKPLIGSPQRSRLPFRRAWAGLAALVFLWVSGIFVLTWSEQDRRVSEPAAAVAPHRTDVGERAPAAGAPVEYYFPPSPADDQAALTRDYGKAADEDDAAMAFSNGGSRTSKESPRRATTGVPDTQAQSTSRPEVKPASTRGPEQKAAAAGLPGVYIHVRDPKQHSRAVIFVSALERRGIRVTGIKVVRAGPSTPDLRYFHREEAAEAARIARALHDAGFASPRLKRIGGRERSYAARQYELWLPPETAPLRR